MELSELMADLIDVDIPALNIDFYFRYELEAMPPPLVSLSCLSRHRTPRKTVAFTTSLTRCHHHDHAFVVCLASLQFLMLLSPYGHLRCRFSSRTRVCHSITIRSKLSYYMKSCINETLLQTVHRAPAGRPYWFIKTKNCFAELER